MRLWPRGGHLRRRREALAAIDQTLAAPPPPGGFEQHDGVADDLGGSDRHLNRGESRGRQDRCRRARWGRQAACMRSQARGFSPMARIASARWADEDQAGGLDGFDRFGALGRK